MTATIEFGLFLGKDFLSLLDFHITSEISTESVIAFITWYLPGSALASCDIVSSLLLSFQEVIFINAG